MGEVIKTSVTSNICPACGVCVSLNKYFLMKENETPREFLKRTMSTGQIKYLGFCECGNVFVGEK